MECQKVRSRWSWWSSPLPPVRGWGSEKHELPHRVSRSSTTPPRLLKSLVCNDWQSLIKDAVQWNNIKSRALGALFFAVIGLLMTAVAVAVLWRFWETPVCQNHPAQSVFHLIFNWGCARLWEGTLMCSHLRHLPLILCSKGKKKLLHIFERGRRSKSWSGSQSWGQS